MTKTKVTTSQTVDELRTEQRQILDQLIADGTRGPVIPQHAPGAKLDQGKNRCGLVLGRFATALWEVCRVGTFGAEKYTPEGWRHVPNAKERYEDALLRHWLHIGMGERYDKESGLLHWAHFTWNALAILWFVLLEEKKCD